MYKVPGANKHVQSSRC